MGNALIFHGGGLVDPSKEVILKVARKIYDSEVYDRIYLGRYSFMSLYDTSLWAVYDKTTGNILKDARGTYFGTCRGIDVSKPEIMKKSLMVLQANDISTIIVCGGDGSSRNCAEIAADFEKEGINIIFAVPLTVDGINGGYSIGLDQAVREAVRQIENVAATSLETRDNGEFSVVAVELQGRNRDDILTTVLQYFWRHGIVAECELNDILLRVVPANYETNQNALFEEINTSDKRTLVLVSEGAKIKVSDFQKNTHRKVRTVVVGHAVQSNGMTNIEDMIKYSDWLDDVGRLIGESPYDTFSIVNDGIARRKEPIYYYAKLNPRDGQKAEISKGLEELMKRYMAL